MRERLGNDECLEAFATVAAGSGQADAAARLLGAAQAERGRMGVPVPAVDRADLDATTGTARAVLGEAALAASWSVGRDMSFDDAIALAWAVARPIATLVPTDLAVP
jgi:hypothetical protein